jgi:prepilin-type N-terminal cleavage/methylation domain-containing protein
MRKGFTLIDVVIVVVILGIMGLVMYSKGSRYSVEYRCNEAGYVKLSQVVGNRYCTKVVNGNTVVIHVDSIR